jgi:pimeloyl-ACP methyl ester carboxylesterase/plasmid stabilization system protein ParE
VELPETRYANTADGVHIAYQVLGDGSTDLVFAPGTVSHVEIYWENPRLARFLRRLASFARLMVFDKRGTGLSDRVTEAATLEERMDDIRAVMDACASERAVVLGVSEGAPMAALFGAIYPERTVGLILYGGYAKGLPSDDYPWIPTREEQLADIDEWLARWGSWDADVWADLAPSASDDLSLAAWWNKLFRYGSSPSASLALELMNMEIDISPILPTIRVPTLVLHRTGDRACKIEEGRYIAERIPGSTLVELSGDDHPPFLGDTDAIVNRIEAFTKESWREIEPDRVLVTVLFTDIVGSTARAAELGDASWRQLVERHHELVRSQLTRYRGREMDTAGDGFFATFDGPARAVRCARAAATAVKDLGPTKRSGSDVARDRRRSARGDRGVRIMRVREAFIIVALLGVIVLAPATPASAATVRVTGTITVVSEPPCEAPFVTGVIVRCHTEGFIDTWAGGISGTGVYDENVTLNFVTGVFYLSGSETISDACVGDRCGTLESTFHASGLVDLETFAIIFADGQQRFISGTGDLKGAKGSILFSFIDGDPATYEGSIVL